MTRILVVDDEADQRLRIKHLLTQQGYQVLEAGDGFEALEVLQNHDVQIVITDWSMPNLDGLQLCRAIRAGESSGRIYVVFLTSHGEKASLVEGIDAGADDYLTKPAHPAELSVRVRNGERTLKAREDLESVNARLQQDLEAAARIQRALLPTALPDSDRVHFAWTHQPSATLAGDHLNIFPLDERHVGLYLLDVSGHGVPASLLAVTVSRFLSPSADASFLRTAIRDGAPARFARPSEVVERLNHQFVKELAETKQFFTLFYGILDLHTLEMCYAIAGHPGPIITSAGAPPRVLKASSFPVGIVEEPQFADAAAMLRPGERFWLYSDGLPEAMSPQGEMFGMNRLSAELQALGGTPLCEGIQNLWKRVKLWTGEGSPRDDVSVVALDISEAPALANQGERRPNMVLNR
jgi:sigma-B regulation protein RsbU (phosphoserine phosphatase)